MFKNIVYKICIGEKKMEDFKIDLRIVKTKKNLYESLLRLMATHAFEEIKVSKICEEAMINRSTFYAHFEDKYALFNSLILDLKDSLKSELDKNESILGTKGYYMQLIRLLLDHVEEKKDIYTTVMVYNRNSVAMDMIYSALKEDVLNRLNQEKKVENLKVPSDFVSNFYLGAIFQVGMEWIRSKCAYSKEEIIRYLEILIPEDV